MEDFVAFYDLFKGSGSGIFDQQSGLPYDTIVCHMLTPRMSNNTVESWISTFLFYATLFLL